jgi:hypothetical protein
VPSSLMLLRVPRDKRFLTASGLMPSARAASGTVSFDTPLGMSPSPTRGRVNHQEDQRKPVDGNLAPPKKGRTMTMAPTTD